MPLPFLLFTSILASRMFGAMGRGGPPDMGMPIALALGSILFSAALLALIVLLAGASSPVPNARDSSG